MLRVSAINFNQASKANQSANYQQNPQLRMHSMQMNDTVSFGMAEKIIKPIAKNSYKYLGHNLIENQEYRQFSISTKLYNPDEAKAIAMDINAKATEMRARLSSYKPNKLKEWAMDVLKTKDENVKAFSHKGNVFDPELFGENEELVKVLKEETGVSGNHFLGIQRESLRGPVEHIEIYNDERIGSEMKPYLRELFKDANKSLYFKKDGKLVVIKSTHNPAQIDIFQPEKI